MASEPTLAAGRLPATRTAAGLPARKPWAAPTVVFIAILLSVYLCSPNYRWSAVRQAPYAGDFLQEWIGGYAVLSGDRARLYDPNYAKALEHDSGLVGFEFDRRLYFPLVYPPFYYLAVSPLSQAPYRAAAALWSLLMCAALAATMALGIRFTTRRPAGEPEASNSSAACWGWWTVPGAVLFPPLLESLNSGQKATVCLLLYSSVFFLLKRRRPLAAGMVLGLLAFKPQLVIVVALAMLLKRQLRFTAGAMASLAALVLISLLAGGEACRQYLDFLLGAADYIHTSGYELHESHSLYGCISLAWNGSPAAAKAATIVALAVLTCILGRLLRGPLEPSSPRFDLQYSALVMASLLVSPHLLTYDLTVLLLPMFLVGRQVLMGRHVLKNGLDRRRLQQAAALLGLLYLLAGLSPAIAGRTHIQLTTLIMTAVVAALCWSDRPIPTQAGVSGSLNSLSI